MSPTAGAKYSLDFEGGFCYNPHSQVPFHPFCPCGYFLFTSHGGVAVGAEGSDSSCSRILCLHSPIARPIRAVYGSVLVIGSSEGGNGIS